MILKCLPYGMFGSNTYIIGKNGEGAVIDAGVESEDIISAAEEAALKIKYIVLTHGHIDHICAVDELRKKTGAKVLINQGDGDFLSDAFSNGSALFGGAKSFGAADELVQDGDIINVGGLKLEILHTPGHSSGCICIKTGDAVFTGDTLFRLSIGRTDLAGGSHPQIIKSIKEKLLVLEDATVVYPGHGESTTIGFEKKRNPYLR